MRLENVCVCYLEEASQLKIWVGEQSQVGEVFGIFLARFNFLIFPSLRKFSVTAFEPQNAVAFSSETAFSEPFLVLCFLQLAVTLWDLWPTRQEVRTPGKCLLLLFSGGRVCITEWKWRHRTRLPYLLLPQKPF